MQYSVRFPTGTVDYHFNGDTATLHRLAPPARCVIITDSHVDALYAGRFGGYRKIVIPAGETSKSLPTIAALVTQLTDLQAHRKTMLIGIGGGVVTDITGFLASVYMRGIAFGFVPTTLLGMTDAAIGGKNGVNSGLHKNMIGTIRQPQFILYDTSYLQTLPPEEWSNGFAEVIKYGCISDVRILNTLADASLKYFLQHSDKLNELIMGCVHVKNKIVQADEGESGMRKLLNFGHTAGHAFETLHQLPHGYGVALGMCMACLLSETQLGFPGKDTAMLQTLLAKYDLPVKLDFDTAQVMDILTMDKKRNDTDLDYILLQKPGVAQIKPLPFNTIQKALEQFKDAGNH